MKKPFSDRLIIVADDQMCIRDSYWDGKEKTKTYEVAGTIKNYKDAFLNGWFVLPEEEVAKQLPGVDLTDTWIISTEPAATNQVELSLDRLMAVSYTHLDVYKRQDV